MEKKIYFICSFFLFSCCLAIAQVQQTAYYEFTIDPKNRGDYRILKAGDKQIFCLLETNEKIGGNTKKIKITRIDKDLQIVWQKDFFIPKKQYILGYEYHNGYIYLLTSTPNYQYQFLKINEIDGTVENIFYETKESFYISHFSVLDHIIFLGGMVNNYPIVYRFDYVNNKMNVLSSIHQLKIEIVEIKIDEANKRVIVVLSKNYGVKDRGVYINQYDYKGQLISNAIIGNKFKYKFLNLQITILKDKKLFITGTYALKNSSKSQGIYAIKLEKDEVEYVRFYDFSNLKNFFRYLPERQMENLLNQIMKKRQKNKTYYLKYDIFPHKLLVSEDRILFSAEVYKPIIENNNRFRYYNNRGYYSSYRRNITDYHQNTTLGNQNLSWGSIRTSSTNNFSFKNYYQSSKFLYSHSFACAFNKNGKLLWDNSYNFEEKTEKNSPIELCKVAVKNDTVIFTHADEEYIYSKSSMGSQYTDTIRVDTLSLPDQNDKLYSADDEEMIKWYDNHFIYSAIVNIKNKLDASRNRKSFFITKLTHDPQRIEKDKKN